MPLGYMVGDSGLINTETGLQLLGSHWKVRKGVEAPVSGNSALSVEASVIHAKNQNTYIKN
jgi:hypothetical protein